MKPPRRYREVASSETIRNKYNVNTYIVHSYGLHNVRFGQYHQLTRVIIGGIMVYNISENHTNRFSGLNLLIMPWVAVIMVLLYL